MWQKSLQSETTFVSLMKMTWKKRQNQMKLLQVFYSSQVTIAKAKYYFVSWIYIFISDRLLENLVTFTEGILNGKLHFLCSGCRFLLTYLILLISFYTPFRGYRNRPKT